MSRYESFAAARDAIWPSEPISIPPEYAKAELSRDLCKRVSTGSGVYTVTLWGGPGTGKTYQAWGLVRHHVNTTIQHGRPLMLAINESETAARRWDDHALDAVAWWPGVLIVDDLGYRCHAEQMPNEWLQHAAYVIANTRSNNHLMTVYTTNLNQERMAHCYGNMVASRIFSGAVIAASGKDRRAKE